MRRIAFMILAGVIALLPPIVAAKRLDGARSRSESAEAVLRATHRDASEIIELRSSQEQVAIRRRPEEHVLAQVNAVLAEAGIPSRKLQGVKPEADQAVPSSSAGDLKYRRQSVSISLQQMTVSELGQFLAAWRNAQMIWTPSRIELSKSRGNDENHYDVTLVISAVYIADA